MHSSSGYVLVSAAPCVGVFARQTIMCMHAHRGETATYHASDSGMRAMARGTHGA